MVKFLCAVVIGVLLCGPAIPGEYAAVELVVGAGATELENRYADLLADQIRRRCAVAVRVAPESERGSERNEGLSIWFGVPDRHAALKSALASERIELPTERDPGPEGFLLRTSEKDGAVFAAGVDSRGLLYASGEILRRTVFGEQSVAFPDTLEVWAAPAFEIRGTMVSQGHTITQLTGSREWTEDDWRQAVLDYTFAGANTFCVGFGGSEDNPQYRFITSLGLKTLASHYPNAGSGPPEWAAVEAIGRQGYLCLSVPEAWDAAVKRVENAYKDCARVDYVRFYSGDGGGCECDKCAPFGGKYIRLCEELAAIIHKRHPDTQIFATNQKLDNAGDEAIFAYLNEKPNPWLRGLSYGPGSNAMGWMPGRRQDHRMDLFRYPGFGSMGRYALEMVHQLPPNIDLLFYTDITHWVYSQYGLMDHELIADRNKDLPPRNERRLYERKPDPNLARVYDRRSFHARPRNYYFAFQETMRYGIGDVVYSEGHHDHFNQWMWQRLLWAPHTPLDAVVLEYARTFFGTEAAPLMAEAILQQEDNLSKPILGNTGIDRQINLVREAGRAMPAHVMRKNYLWRQYLQKALLEKYIQLDVARQNAAYQNTVRTIQSGLESAALPDLVRQAQGAADDTAPTEEMIALKTEAGRLGKESDEIYGVRSEGFFNLDQDYVGLGWLRSQLAGARNAQDEAGARGVLRLIAHYEDPGDGGFYDDAGNPEKSPHLVYGWPYGDGDFSGSNRPSQRTAAFTTDERQGVTFEYAGLDPGAAYRVRVTLVRPRYLPRFAKFQHQTSQSIYADDHVLAKDLELPEYDAKFFEFDVPREATQDGKLRIWFEKQEGIGEGPRPEVTVWRNTGGWGTLVSEVWLLKQK